MAVEKVDVKSWVKEVWSNGRNRDGQDDPQRKTRRRRDRTDSEADTRTSLAFKATNSGCLTFSSDCTDKTPPAAPPAVVTRWKRECDVHMAFISTLRK